jgi:hypothetical protein
MVQNKKSNIPAPEVVWNCNKFVGGVDKHDKLQSTFALGKQHKFKKYCVKLLLFLVDVALASSWIYYKLASPGAVKKEESRANIFLMLAKEMVR